MKRILAAAIIMIGLGLLSGPAGADAIGTTDDPLMIGGGARPIGMGKAFGAVVDDCDAIFINPAGLALLKRPQVMSMFTNLLGGDIYYAEYCGAIPGPFGAIGFGYISTGVNGIETTVNGVPVLTDYYDSVLAFAYSSSLARFFTYANNVFVGGSLKIFNRGFTGGLTRASTGFSADFGLKAVLSPNLNLGLTRQNFLPFSLGAGLKSTGGLEEALSGDTKLALAVKPVQFGGRLLLTGDLAIPSQSTRPLTLHFGSEWKTTPNLTLRLGLDQGIDAAGPGGTSWNPTLGTSLYYAGFRLDYAFHPYYNDAALAAHYVSFSYSGDSWLALEGRVE